MTERANGWAKTVITVAVLLVPFLVGWGAIDSKVSEIKATQLRVLVEKADKELVNTQYRVIIEQLARLDAKMDRHVEQGARR